jgi:hypothetical protein
MSMEVVTKSKRRENKPWLQNFRNQENDGSVHRHFHIYRKICIFILILQLCTKT